MRYRSIAGAVYSLVLTTNAIANPGAPPVELVLGGVGPEFTLSLPDQQIVVNSSSVRSVQVESVILSFDGDVVSSASSFGLSLASTAADNGNVDQAHATQGPVQEIGFAARHAEVVGLSGPHMQVLTLTVTLDGVDHAIVDSYSRFMDITSEGIHLLTSNEYSDLVTPTTLAVDRNRRVVNAASTIAGPPLDPVIRIADSQRAVLIELSKGDAADVVVKETAK